MKLSFFSPQIYRHLPVSNLTDNDESISRRDLKQAVINLIDSEVCVTCTCSLQTMKASLSRVLHVYQRVQQIWQNMKEI